LLNDLGVKEEEVFNATDLSEETFKSASSMLNNAKMSIADQFKKVNDTMSQVINARNTMVGKQNELLSEWHDAAMSDNDLYFSPEEVNKWVEGRGGMDQLTDYESRWLQTVLSENKDKTVALENNISSIATTDIKSDIAQSIIKSGLTTKEAGIKALENIENSKKTDAEKQIYRRVLFDVVSNASKASGSSSGTDLDEQFRADTKEQLKIDHQSIKGLLDYACT
jgi:hypothetical protein